MRAVKNPTKSVRALFVMTLAILVCAAGCSTAGMPSVPAYAEFLTDFAREALAAWLL